LRTLDKPKDAAIETADTLNGAVDIAFERGFEGGRLFGLESVGTRVLKPNRGNDGLGVWKNRTGFHAGKHGVPSACPACAPREGARGNATRGVHGTMRFIRA
jgi:hypothetical protein